MLNDGRWSITGGAAAVTEDAFVVVVAAAVWMVVARRDEEGVVSAVPGDDGASAAFLLVPSGTGYDALDSVVVVVGVVVEVVMAPVAFNRANLNLEGATCDVLDSCVVAWLSCFFSCFGGGPSSFKDDAESRTM